MEHQLKIVGYICLAFALSWAPILHWPVTWFQTFFHEISHGIAAILTGGKITKITLSFDGSGQCITRGGGRFLITFSGYVGASLWGLFVFRMAKSQGFWIISLLVALVVCCLIFWVRDIQTAFIVLIILSLLIALSKLQFPKIQSQVLEFIGIYILIDAIKSPFYLMDGKNLGDGYTLSKLTYIPEFFWIFIWFSIALSLLILISELNSKIT